MNTTNANAIRRRTLPLTAVGLSLVASFATGLWTGQSYSFTGNAPAAVVAAKASPAAVADVAPETFPIVPSPVIELHPQFFFGTGDGNGGYYQAP